MKQINHKHNKIKNKKPKMENILEKNIKSRQTKKLNKIYRKAQNRGKALQMDGQRLKTTNKLNNTKQNNIRTNR